MATYDVIDTINKLSETHHYDGFLLLEFLLGFGCINLLIF